MKVVGSVEALNALPVGATLCDSGCCEGKSLVECHGHAWVKQANGEWHLYIDGKRSSARDISPPQGIVTQTDRRNLENLARWTLSEHQDLYCYLIQEEDNLT